MWGSKRQMPDASAPVSTEPLKDAVRQARIDAAERTNVVVDLRDADVARLELLSEALDPVFKDIPPEVDLFERGVSRGETPRLWIDVVAYVMMGRDKRIYRFVQDTRYGRKILSESPDIAETAKVVTRYIAGRLVERDRALSSNDSELSARGLRFADTQKRRQRWRSFRTFLLGLIVGVAALIGVALLQGTP